MPIRTTYPNQFGGPGKVLTDFGIFEETFQGYAQIPTTPIASVQLLDADSPNPLSPVPLTITASANNPRCYVSIIGTVQSALGGSDITLSAAGTIKVASSLAIETSVTSSGSPTAGSPRLLNGNLITGTSIPRNSVIVAGGFPNSGFTTTGLITTNLSYSVFGATNDLAAATALNISSNIPSRPAFVLVTIRTLVRKWRVQTVADYPDLPRNVRELLQITT